MKSQPGHCKDDPVCPHTENPSGTKGIIHLYREALGERFVESSDQLAS